MMSMNNFTGDHCSLKGGVGLIDDNESSYGSIGSSDLCCHDYASDDLESCPEVSCSDFIISVKVQGAPPRSPSFSAYIRSAQSTPEMRPKTPSNPYISIVTVDEPKQQASDSDNDSDGYGSFLSTSDEVPPETNLLPTDSPLVPVKTPARKEVDDLEEDKVTKECRQFFEKRLECTRMRWREASKDFKGDDPHGSEQGGDLNRSSAIDDKLSHLREEIVSLMSLDNDLFQQLLTLQDSVRELKQDHWKDIWEEDSEVDSSRSVSDDDDDEKDVGCDTDYSHSPSSTLSSDTKPRSILKNRGHLMNTSFIRQRISYPPTSKSRERRICRTPEQRLSKSNSFCGSPYGIRKLRSHSFTSSMFSSPEYVIPEAASLSSLQSGFESWVLGTRVVQEEIYV